jgi:hypothetical protein
MDIPSATSPDTSRPAAPNADNDHTLSLEQASELYAKAGHPRTLRSLQRYCVNGHLDARKIQTTLGDKYLVTPQSVARHIAQIEELHALDTVATSPAFSRPVATDVVPQQSPTEAALPSVTGDDSQRQETTGKRDASRYVERLEREVEMFKDERDFYREQIDRKDKTIDSLLERDRETNFLIRGLQDLIPRLRTGQHQGPSQENASA